MAGSLTEGRYEEMSPPLSISFHITGGLLILKVYKDKSVAIKKSQFVSVSSLGPTKKEES